MLPLSAEVQKIVNEAHVLAEETGHGVTSLHLLLAMFSEVTHPNQAYSVLLDRGIALDEILDQLQRQPREPAGSVAAIMDKCQEMARGTQSSIVNSLHLLLAVTRIVDSVAWRILRAHHPDLNEFRAELFDLIQNFPTRLLDDSPAPRPRPATVAAPQVAAPAAPSRQLPTSPAGALRPLQPLPEVRPAPATTLEVAHAPEPLTETVVASQLPAQPAPAREFRPRSRFELNPQEYPFLAEFGRNLTQEAERGAIDPLIGRAAELEALAVVLNKRRSNNPCLIGRPGVGKTSIAEGYALEIVKGTQPHHVVVQLNASDLTAGTALRGSFAERLKGIREEVARANGTVIVFADEIHLLLRAGGGDGTVDAGNDLKGALARGEFPCIGATTDEEYRRYILADPALERRFQPITIPEPRPAEAVEILKGIRPAYEVHHGASYSNEVLAMLVRAACRYVTDRALPDSAINLMDAAGSTARLAGRTEVCPDDVARVLANLLQIPRERVVVDDEARLLDMEQALARRIVGHEHVLHAVAEAIRRAYAGFSTKRPMGSFLFLGPPAVGKGELARALAEFLFGGLDALTRINLGEYTDRHDSTKLLGAPPSYVGYEEGGLLSRVMLKRPYQILVFEDAEHAHPAIQGLVARLLEEGELTDNQGRRLDFSNALVILVSRVGGELLTDGRRSVGFARGGGSRPADQEVLERARQALTPELWAALDEKLVFFPPDPAQREEVGRRIVDKVRREIEADQGLRFRVTPALVRHLLEQAGGAGRGAGPDLGRVVRRGVEGALSTWVLRGGATRGCELLLDYQDGITVKVSTDDQG